MNVILIATLVYSVVFFLSDIESEAFRRDVDRAMRDLRDSNK